MQLAISTSAVSRSEDVWLQAMATHRFPPPINVVVPRQLARDKDGPRRFAFSIPFKKRHLKRCIRVPPEWKGEEPAPLPPLVTPRLWIYPALGDLQKLVTARHPKRDELDHPLDGLFAREIVDEDGRVMKVKEVYFVHSEGKNAMWRDLLHAWEVHQVNIAMASSAKEYTERADVVSLGSFRSVFTGSDAVSNRGTRSMPMAYGRGRKGLTRRHLEEAPLSTRVGPVKVRGVWAATYWHKAWALCCYDVGIENLFFHPSLKDCLSDIQQPTTLLGPFAPAVVFAWAVVDKDDELDYVSIPSAPTRWFSVLPQYIVQLQEMPAEGPPDSSMCEYDVDTWGAATSWLLATEEEVAGMDIPTALELTAMHEGYSRTILAAWAECEFTHLSNHLRKLDLVYEEDVARREIWFEEWEVWEELTENYLLEHAEVVEFVEVATAEKGEFGAIEVLWQLVNSPPSTIASLLHTHLVEDLLLKSLDSHPASLNLAFYTVAALQLALARLNSECLLGYAAAESISASLMQVLRPFKDHPSVVLPALYCFTMVVPKPAKLQDLTHTYIKDGRNIGNKRVLLRIRHHSRSMDWYFTLMAIIKSLVDQITALPEDHTPSLLGDQCVTAIPFIAPYQESAGLTGGELVILSTLALRAMARINEAHAAPKEMVKSVLGVMDLFNVHTGVLTEGFAVLAELILAYPDVVKEQTGVMTHSFATCERLHYSIHYASSLQPLFESYATHRVSSQSVRLLGCLAAMATVCSSYVKEAMNEHYVLAFADAALRHYILNRKIVKTVVHLLRLLSTSVSLRLAMARGGLAVVLQQLLESNSADPKKLRLCISVSNLLKDLHATGAVLRY